MVLLQQSHILAIDFISYQENIDTTTPTGELIFPVMASLAQIESSLISQRVKAGMARAKAQGKQISRPKRGFNIILSFFNSKLLKAPLQVIMAVFRKVDQS